MNLLQVGVKLKAENIQSFIDDFLKVDGVVISDIQLHDDMILINRIKYKSFGTISVGLKLERIEDGVLSITIKKIKAISIPISVVPVNFILKMVLNKVNISGVLCDGKQIKVDLSVLLEEFDVNFLALDIKDIQITKEDISVVVNNVDFDMVELMKKSKKTSSQSENQTKQLMASDVNIVENNNLINNGDNYQEFSGEFEVEDDFTEENLFSKESKTYFSEYSRIRDNLYNEKFKKLDKELLGKIVFILPDIGVLSYRLLRDKRVKKGVKILLVFTLIYLINPVDIINEKFSILNKIDDSLLLMFTLNKIFTSIDRRIIEYHFDGSEDTLDFLIDTFDLLNQFLGLDRINRLYTVFEKFVK